MLNFVITELLFQAPVKKPFGGQGGKTCSVLADCFDCVLSAPGGHSKRTRSFKKNYIHELKIGLTLSRYFDASQDCHAPFIQLV